MMARPQFISNASLLLVKDAADYARDPEHGGEVFFTGQSQGAYQPSARLSVQEVLNTWKFALAGMWSRGRHWRDRADRRDD
jgi:hypothetical protein